MGNLSLQNLLSGDFHSRTLFFPQEEPDFPFLADSPGSSIYIGKTQKTHCPFFWNPNLLANPHMGVLGISGSGKSYLVKSLLTRASLSWNANALILDWSGEYTDWVRSAGGKVIDFTKGHCLNLLETTGSKEERTTQIMDALELLTDISQFPSQKRITEWAIRKAYANSPNKTPTMQEVLSNLSSLGVSAPKGPPAPNSSSSLSQEKKESAEECIYRLEKLCQKGSSYFFGESTLPLDSLKSSGLVCIDLHSLPSEQSRSLAGLSILQFLVESMRKETLSTGLPKLFVVIDEAWKIAREEGGSVSSIVREGRKYGFSLIVASQNPTDVSKSILSNAGTLFIFRLLLSEHRAYVRKSLGYTKEIDSSISSFPVGSCAVHLAPKGKISGGSAFIVNKVDGEEPLTILKIGGDGMKFEFERESFRRKLASFGLEGRELGEILARFSDSGNSVPASELVLLLEKRGFARSRIISLFRELGAGEQGLISLFSQMQRERIGAESDKLAALVVEE